MLLNIIIMFQIGLMITGEKLIKVKEMSLNRFSPQIEQWELRQYCMDFIGFLKVIYQLN